MINKLIKFSQILYRKTMIKYILYKEKNYKN
jgi:hypothetical protein